MVFEHGNGLLGAGNTASGPAAVTPATWHHLVLRVDARDQQVISTWVDGVDRTADAGLAHSFRRAGEWVLGATREGAYPWNGALADLQIYTGLLSADEIVQLSTNPGGAVTDGFVIRGRDGLAILNGAGVSVAAGTDFGAMPVFTSASLPLTPEAGEKPVSITRILRQGDNSFTVPNLVRTLPAGATTNVTVQFTPLQPRRYAGTVVVSNSVSGRYEVQMSGRGFALEPSSSLVAGGVEVWIESDPLGSGSDVTEVRFGNRAATILYQDAARVRVLAPSSSVIGPVDVVIRSASLGETRLPNAFEYEVAPIIYAAVTGMGSVSPTGGVQVPMGSELSFDIVPADHHDVVDVRKDGVSVGAMTRYTWVDVRENGILEVEFAPRRTATPQPVPHAWLAEQGITGDWDDAAMRDLDGDGMITWQEYVAGTNPNDDRSYFRVESIEQPGRHTEIRWYPSTPDRRYRILWSPSLTGGAPVELRSDIRYPVNSVLIDASELPATGLGFFHVQVEQP